ncbi:hypothetical protein D3C79_856960 [compost metagenome]
MQFIEQVLLFIIGEAQFFREDQRTTGQQRLADAAEQLQALVGGDELQGEIHRHHRGGLEGQGQDVGFQHLHRQQFLEHRVLGGEVLTATLDHRRGVVHGDYPAAVTAHMAAQRLGNGTQRRTQVVQRGMRLGEARGQHAEVLDDGRVARYRALDHVREHAHHVFVEDKVGHLLQGLGEKAVGLFAHGGLDTG